MMSKTLELLREYTLEAKPGYAKRSTFTLTSFLQLPTIRLQDI